MTPRTLFVLGLATISGLSAALGVSRFRQTQTPQQAAPQIETVPVLVAAADLPRGSTVMEAGLAVKQMNKDAVPENALTTVEEAVNRAVVADLFAGDIVLDRKLNDPNAGRGLGGMLPEGLRAFTIDTPKVSSNVAGFILPGNRVDVLMTTNSRQSGANGTQGIASMLLQNVEILAVQQHVSAPAENRVELQQLQSVTLMVTPEQSLRLSLAQQHGDLQLSLRGNNDDVSVDVAQVTVDQLPFMQGEANPTREEIDGLRAEMAASTAALREDFDRQLVQQKSEFEKKQAEQQSRHEAERKTWMDEQRQRDEEIELAKAELQDVLDEMATRDAAPPPPLPIRTLRGIQWGRLYQQEYQPPAAGGEVTSVSRNAGERESL